MAEQTGSYASAGVDINAGQEAVRLMRPHVESTFNPRVLSDIGGFGGLFRLDAYREPVLVASTDGVGTKINVAIAMESFASIGADLVNHCINDLWVQGADPLFFLDYLASGRLNPAHAAEIVRGMADAARDAGCAIIGGETAEMPGTYEPGSYDIAGFMVGAAERWDLIDGSGVRAGDTLLGFPSTGLHTNGFSLARRAFDLDQNPARLSETPPELDGRTLAEALLAVHQSYYQPLKPFQKRLRALAHITGGGFVDNVPRVIPAHLRAIIDRAAWDVPPLFRLIQQHGGVDRDEMYRVFNMGIGMVAAVRPGDAQAVMTAMDGSRPIGTVVERAEADPPVTLL